MNQNQKKGIRISALSFPAAYIIGVILFHITRVIDTVFPGLIIVAASQVTILPLVIVLNVVALIVAFGGNNQP